uniref:CRAL-TRIO domain-containing protein n=1 Tax=Macrostomum lignano TaxID=282301 RepID=A0A1I8FKB0_9PLAT
GCSLFGGRLGIWLQRSQARLPKEECVGGVGGRPSSGRCSSHPLRAGGGQPPRILVPGAVLEGWVDVRDILMSRVHPSHAAYIHFRVYRLPDRAHPICKGVVVANYTRDKGTALLTWLDDLMVDKQTNYTKYSVSQVLAMCAVSLHPAVRAESWRNRFDASVTVAGVLWLVLLVTSLGRQDLSCAPSPRGLRCFFVVFRLFTLAGKHPTLKMLMLTVLMSTFKSFFIILGMCSAAGWCTLCPASFCLQQLLPCSTPNDEDALLSHTDIRQFQNTWNLLDDSLPRQHQPAQMQNSAENAYGPAADHRFWQTWCSHQAALQAHDLDWRSCNGPGDVSFHDVLIMLRGHPQESAAAGAVGPPGTGVHHRGGGAKQTIKDWLDSCVKRKARPTRPPSAAFSATCAPPTRQPTCCRRPRRRSRSLHRWTSLAVQPPPPPRRRKACLGSPAAAATSNPTMLGGRQRPPALPDDGRQATQTGAGCEPTGGDCVGDGGEVAYEDPGGTGDGRGQHRGRGRPANDADYDEENRDVIGGIERAILRGGPRGGSPEAPPVTHFAHQQLPGSEGLVEEATCCWARPMAWWPRIWRTPSTRRSSTRTTAASEAPPVSTADDEMASDSDCQIVGCTLSPPKKQPPAEQLVRLLRPQECRLRRRWRDRVCFQKEESPQQKQKEEPSQEKPRIRPIWITSLAAALSSGRKAEAEAMRRLMKMTKRRGTPRRRDALSSPTMPAFNLRFVQHARVRVLHGICMLCVICACPAALAHACINKYRLESEFEFETALSCFVSEDATWPSCSRLSSATCWPPRLGFRRRGRSCACWPACLCRARRFHRPGRLRYPELGAPPELAAAGLAELGLSRASPKASPAPELAELLSLCSCPELIDVAKRLGGGVASSLVGAGRRRDGLTRTLLRASANSRLAAGFLLNAAARRPHAGCAAPSWPPSGRRGGCDRRLPTCWRRLSGVSTSSCTIRRPLTCS